MNRRIEVWSTPDDSAGFRWLCSPPIISASTMDRAVDEVPGAGSITIPANYPYLSLILDLDPSDVAGSAASSLIVILQENPNPASGSGEPETIWEPIFEFFAEDHTEQITDAGPTITISGPHIRSALDDGVVYPKSTYEPHYQWGAPTLTQNADLTESTIADEEINLWTTATSGSFTIDVESSGTPATIDYDFTATEVKTALEALSTVTDVRVSGTGTADDPWRVIFVDPGGQDLTFTTDFSGLTGGDLFIEIVVEGGQSTPSYYQKSQTIEGVEYGVHGGASFAVVDDPFDSGSGEKALRIVGNSEFIGAQQIVDVEPSSTGYATVELGTTSATDEFRLVVRTATLEEGFIGSTGGSAGFEGITVTPNQWNTLTIPDVQLLPRHGDQIIVRIAVVSQGNPTDFYIKNLKWHPGLPGTTAGDISQILSTAASGTRGALSWLDLSDFDDTLDSNGISWDTNDLAFQADAGEKLGTHVHGDLQSMGYELDLVRIPADELGSDGLTHRLQLFNPGGRGAAAGPNTAIVIGSGISSGDISKRRVPFTHVLVETYDGLFVEVTDARVSGLPRREHFIRAEQARDLATAQKVGAAVLDAAIENLFATQVTLVGDTTVAYRDFEIGSEVPYTLGSNRASKHTRRIHTISMSFDGDRWADTITASKIFPSAGTTGRGGSGDSPLMLEAMRKLYARFDRRRRSEKRSRIIQPPPNYSVFLETPGVPSIGPDIIEWTGNGPDPTIPLPSNMSVGDVMFLASQIESATLDSVPTGWIDHGQIAATATGGGAGIILAKDVTASDISAGSITLDMASSEELAVVIWYVSSTSDTAATVAISSENPSLTADPSPETVPVTVTDADEYWIFPIWYSNKGSFPTDQQSDGPSGYDAFAEADVGGGVLAPAVYVWEAYKSLTTSEDPGAFSWSSSAGSRVYAHATIAVRDEPAAGAGSPGLAASDHTHLIEDITDLLEGISIDDLSDVELGSGGPTDGQILVFDATSGVEAWVPEDPAAGVSSIDDLTDVELGSGGPTEGQILVWDDAAGQFQPADESIGATATDTHVWRPLLDDDGAIVTDDDGAAVMGYGPA